MAHKRSFFERLTGSVHINDEDELEETTMERRGMPLQQRSRDTSPETGDWTEEVEGELTVDMYQTPDAVVVPRQ